MYINHEFSYRKVKLLHDVCLSVATSACDKQVHHLYSVEYGGGELWFALLTPLSLCNANGSGGGVTTVGGLKSDTEVASGTIPGSVTSAGQLRVGSATSDGNGRGGNGRDDEGCADVLSISLGTSAT